MLVFLCALILAYEQKTLLEDRGERLLERKKRGRSRVMLSDSCAYAYANICLFVLQYSDDVSEKGLPRFRGM